jgi:WD40 repeat protein
MEYDGWQKLAQLEGVSFPICFSADGRTMTARKAGGFRQFSTATWQRTGSTISDLRGLEHLREFSPDGRWLAAAAMQRIELWDMIANAKVAELERSENEKIMALAFSPDSRWLAAVHWTGDVKVWEAASQRVVATFQVNGGSVHGLAFSPDGKTLATGDDQKIDLWSVVTGASPRLCAAIWVRFARSPFRRTGAFLCPEAKMAPRNCGPLRTSATRISYGRLRTRRATHRRMAQSPSGLLPMEKRCSPQTASRRRECRNQ